MIRELTVQEGATCTSCRIESLRLTEIGVAGPVGQDYAEVEKLHKPANLVRRNFLRIFSFTENFQQNSRHIVANN